MNSEWHQNRWFLPFFEYELKFSSLFWAPIIIKPCRETRWPINFRSQLITHLPPCGCAPSDEKPFLLFSFPKLWHHLHHLQNKRISNFWKCTMWKRLCLFIIFHYLLYVHYLSTKFIIHYLTETFWFFHHANHLVKLHLGKPGTTALRRSLQSISPALSIRWCPIILLFHLRKQKQIDQIPLRDSQHSRFLRCDFLNEASSKLKKKNNLI